MASLLALPAGVRAELEALAQTGYPYETCGLLLGDSSTGRCRIASQRPARNLNRERARDRFELDPDDYLAAESAAAATGIEIVGIWHSHPDHSALPSPTDLAHAWPGWSYVILAVDRGGVGELRSWRLAGNRFVEEEVCHG